MTIQRDQNPDVNSRVPTADPAENPRPDSQDRTTDDVERGRDEPVIQVPPDAQPAAPVEEPPGTGGPPVGDVDDSPKRIG
jgi:hypothetical protein